MLSCAVCTTTATLALSAGRQAVARLSTGSLLAVSISLSPLRRLPQLQRRVKQVTIRNAPTARPALPSPRPRRPRAAAGSARRRLAANSAAATPVAARAVCE